jgi:hypothetical protein
MINDLPEQFVEGINEAAEQLYDEAIDITRFTGVGIQYTPSLSYLLTKVEIMLSFGNIPADGMLDLQVSSDYGDRPSDIKLTSVSFKPKKVYGDWYEIAFNPVSIVKDRKYWLIINANRYQTALIRAKTGNDCTFSVRRGEKWRTLTKTSAGMAIPEEFIGGKAIMVRFYGRIIPLSY